MNMKTTKEGFTLIELSLSMVFVSILSLLIVFIIGDTVASYRRGITFTHVNTVGMEVVDDMRVAIQNASSAPVTDSCEVYYQNNSTLQNTCKSDNAFNFVSVTVKSRVKMKNGTVRSGVPVFGAFCTGTYSYIWNSGYFESDETSVLDASPAYLVYRNDSGTVITKQYSDRTTNGNKPFRLLKVKDTQRGVCVSVVRPYSSGTYAESYALPAAISNKFDISNGYGAVPNNEPPVDLLQADNTNDLVIYAFEPAKPAISDTQKNMFYSASFILGTISGGIDIMSTDGRKCATPNDYENEYYDYCALNKFNFAVQANGE